MTGSSSPPALLLIFGPPAVGKMTVGREISTRTGFPLFHNHIAIEPVLNVFPYESPAFSRLVSQFRLNVLQEAAASNLPGIIFTFVWGFDLPEDQTLVNTYAELFTSRGGRVLFLELEADLDERLRRNDTPLRLAEKPSKNDTEASRRNLLDSHYQHQLNSTSQFDVCETYLRLNTTALPAPVAAEQAVAHFGIGFAAHNRPRTVDAQGNPIADSAIGLRYGTVAVADHQPQWAALAAKQLGHLRNQLAGDASGVEHVGSTAVPGLAAKPIIDLAVRLAPHADPDTIASLLTSQGWISRGNKHDDGGRLFVAERTPGLRTMHLHVLTAGDPQWEQYLLVRDKLRAHPTAAAQYQQLKLDLAAQHPNDRAAYTAAKAQFLTQLLADNHDA